MPERFVDLSSLMAAQEDFEQTRIGTDGTLYDANTVEYGITRGLIGESIEALEAVTAGQMALAKEECVDVLIFLATVFNHLEMTPEEVSELAEYKMQKNYQKYDQSLIEGKPILEGMAHAKEQWGN